MSTFDEALTAAATLPREDQRLLIRELTERFSPEDRWTLVRGLVAVEPIEEWPAVLSGRSSDEVAGLLVQMLLSFEPAAQPGGPMSATVTPVVERVAFPAGGLRLYAHQQETWDARRVHGRLRRIAND